MSKLLASVIPLSIGAAFSPTVFAFTIITLGSKNKPRARVIYMMLGMAIVLTGILFAATSVSQVSKVAGVQRFVQWLDIIFGITLLSLGTRNLFKKADKDKTKERSGHYAKSGLKPTSYISIGFFVMITDVTSLVLFIPAMRNIALSSVVTLNKILVSIIPFMAVLFPALIPLLALIISPDKAGKMMTSIHNWLEQHKRITSVSVTYIFGIYLLWHGISTFIATL